MLPELIDYGSELVTLVALGPPEEVQLDPAPGNVPIAYRVSETWQVVSAVSFTLVTVGAGNRVPTLSWSNDPSAPFCEAASPVAQTAGNTSRYTFAHDVAASGVANGAAVIVPVPLFLLTPGESLNINVGGGLAADTLSLVRLRRQRYVPRPLTELFPGP
jgi:hypothetical protein